MNPNDFQKLVIDWLGAISGILLALTGIIMFLTPRVAKTIESVKDAHDRLNDHSRRITDANTNLMNIALATPVKGDTVKREASK